MPLLFNVARSETNPRKREQTDGRTDGEIWAEEGEASAAIKSESHGDERGKGPRDVDAVKGHRTHEGGGERGAHTKIRKKRISEKRRREKRAWPEAKLPI